MIISDDLMINDVGKPLCIAGVYGGIDSGVSNETQDIFLESAYFNPISIRKTAKRQILSTDASFRYERGCDPNITVYALKRAALLIMELCGGNISSNIIDLYPKKVDDFAVHIQKQNTDDHRIKSRPISATDTLAKILKKQEAPLYVIWGEKDASVGVYLEDRMTILRSINSKVRFHVEFNIGHWIMYENEVLFNNILNNIIQD